jgi:rhodanese-related sulfurtransferase/predicted DNA-binding WGR domain protein
MSLLDALLERPIPEGVRLIDVRTPEEFASGHLKGAVNIPIDTLPSRLSEVGDKSAPVAVYCKLGRRSGRAAEFLQAQGFQQVTDLGPMMPIRLASLNSIPSDGRYLTAALLLATSAAAAVRRGSQIRTAFAGPVRTGRYRRRLEFVDEETNTNKFWEIWSLSDGRFIVSWGRIGTHQPPSQTVTREVADKRYQEKLNKGYREV